MPGGADDHRDSCFEAEGLRLHYLEWGEVSARPLVILHELGDCARGWDRLAAGLASDHRVLVPDQRGHGDSAWAAVDAYSVGDFVSDVNALVEHAGLGGFALMGHGAGGRLAIAYAARHPESVEALIVGGTTLESGPVQGHLVSGQDRWESLDEVVDWLRAAQPNAADYTLAHQAAHLTREGAGGGLVPKRDPVLLDAQSYPDARREWRSLACRALVARGRQSTVLTHEEAVKMREAHPRAGLAELEGGGHWFHQEIPGAFEEMVRWFLGGPPP